MENKLEFDPSTIKWDEAPEGYEFWLQDAKPNIGRDTSGWRKLEGVYYVGLDGSRWNSLQEGEYYTVHTRPAAWDGTGNPPVGATVYTDVPPRDQETDDNPSVETEVRVLGYSQKHSGSAVVTVEESRTGQLHAWVLSCVDLRLESAAIKAEREHMEVDLRKVIGPATSKLVAEHLHKLGYRKP